MLILSNGLQPVSSAGIDCFKCVSLNGSNPMCEDPFHNNYTTDILERPCMVGEKIEMDYFQQQLASKSLAHILMEVEQLW